MERESSPHSRDRDVASASWRPHQGNGAEKGKIVPHVEREAVEGHPVAHAHAERAQLAVADPYAGAAFPAGGLDLERGRGTDDDFFQRADETVQPFVRLPTRNTG